jgi:hypothetical protein
LRVFQGAKGTIQYVGEFVLDELEPYSVATAPSTDGGPVREVFRFHLLPIDRAAMDGEAGQLGRTYQRRDENVEVASPAAVTARDPDAAGRGLRAHNRLQNRLSDLVKAAGYRPVDPEPIDPTFDLAWFVEQTLFLVEVKSCTAANETHQLRMGIGQVVDYEDSLPACGYTVQPVIYLEQPPTQLRWSGLAQRHGSSSSGPEQSTASSNPRSPSHLQPGEKHDRALLPFDCDRKVEHGSRLALSSLVIPLVIPSAVTPQLRTALAGRPR